MRGIAFFIAIILVCYDIINLQHPGHMQKTLHFFVRYQKQGEQE